MSPSPKDKERRKKHKHVWSTDGCRNYQIYSTKFWMFRKCKCGAYQNAIVYLESPVKWREWKVKEVKKSKNKSHAQ